MDFDGTGQGRILDQSLGCTRFSADLQSKITAEMISDQDYFVYHLLDLRFARLLNLHGYRPHVHGSIKHCHKYDEDPAKVEKDRVMRMWGAQQRSEILRAADDKDAVRRCEFGDDQE
jgi:hypothetical protein